MVVGVAIEGAMCRVWRIKAHQPSSFADTEWMGCGRSYELQLGDALVTMRWRMLRWMTGGGMGRS